MGIRGTSEAFPLYQLLMIAPFTNRRRQKAKKMLFLTLSFAISLFTVFVHGIPALPAERIAKAQSNAAHSSVWERGFRDRDFLLSQSDLSVLVQQGRDYYEADQFDQAATVWEKAASSFATQGDRLNQAMVLSNISLAYQHLGQWTQAKAAIRNAIASLDAKSLDLLQAGTGTSEARSRILAQALNTQGSLQLALGQAEEALATWQQAAAVYQQVNDEVGMLKSQINQAQALKSLGFYRRALATLTQVNQALQKQPDSLIKAAALRSLGSAFLLTGELEQSRQLLQQSLTIAQHLQSAQDTAATLYDLGNTARVEKDTKAALDYYQQAAASATSPVTKIQSQLNQLNLLIETQQESAAQTLWPKIQSQLDNLPPSRATVYAQIDLAMALMKLSALNYQSTTENPQPSVLKTNSELKADKSVLLFRKVEIELKTQCRCLEENRLDS